MRRRELQKSGLGQRAWALAGVGPAGMGLEDPEVLKGSDRFPDLGRGEFLKHGSGIVAEVQGMGFCGLWRAMSEQFLESIPK